MELDKSMEFITELTYNNNRDWFMEHKGQYLEAKAQFEAFVDRLILGINAFDPETGLQSAASCCYRIYRDVRFSNDKSPYKTWMGAYICPGGRKSALPGYYFHIEPVSDTLIGHHLLAAGLYRPDAVTLRNIRSSILEHGSSFDKAVRAAEGFTLDEGLQERLSRIPAGYPKDFQYADYLKCRQYCLSAPIDAKDISAEYVISRFKSTLIYMSFIRKAMKGRYSTGR